MGIFVGIYCLILKAEHKLNKYFNIIAALSFAVLFSLQVYFANKLRFTPAWDLEAVFSGATELLNKGTFTRYSSDTCHKDYFYIFPNNGGELFLLYTLFKIASVFKITDFFMAASVFNSFICSFTMVITACIVRHYFGAKGGIFVIILFLLSPPFWFMGAVFYSDTLSMIFPVLGYGIFLISEKTNVVYKKVILYCAVAVTLGIGMLIKPTVLILLIGIVISLVLKADFKKLALFVATSAVFIGVINLAFNAVTYRFLDKETLNEKKMPVSYWLAVGANDDGYYNNNILAEGLNEADPVQRNKKLLQTAKSGYKNKGVTGVIKHFAKKSSIAFGDGTYALSSFLDDGPVKQSSLHSFLLYGRENYKIYSHISTGIFLAIQTLMLFGIFKRRNINSIIPLFCIFGLMLFLLFWEISPRYIINFIPMIFISASFGVCNVDCIYKTR